MSERNIIEQNIDFQKGYHEGILEGQKIGLEMMIKAIEMQTSTRYVCCEHCKDDFLKLHPNGEVVKR